MDENETGFPGMFSEGPQPLSLIVPIYNMTEVDLMRALEQVVQKFDGPPPIGGYPQPDTPARTRRAIDWLHAKYGTPDTGAAGGGGVMDKVSNILLPDGWEADGEWHGCHAFKHDEFGWLTVNFESRTAGTGLCSPRRDSSLVTGSSYKGRGWQQRLVTEAIAAAERLWHGDTRTPDTGASHE